MEAYLDNSATTKCYDSVRDVMCQTLTEDYGNPSAMHQKGVDAEKYMKDARENVAASLKVKPKEIYFTSGGTEADNLAIIGTALANQRAGMHIITSAIEHPAVYNAMNYLQEQGFDITYLSVNQDGVIDLQQLEQAICEKTILISIMYVNNEIGTRQPVSQVVELIKKVKPSVLLHVDAVQGYGKYKIYPKKEGIDLLTMSGHKIHGPKGIGALYVSEKVKIKPLLFGGGQQMDIRPGTENIPGIAGMGQAVKEIYNRLQEKTEEMLRLKEMLIRGLKELPDVVIHTPEGDKSAPHIVSAGFRGVRSEVLLHALEDKGVYVSAGSACSSNHPAVSGTLKAVGVEKDLLDATLRFSLSEFTTEEEITYCLDVLTELLPVLRKYARH